MPGTCAPWATLADVCSPCDDYEFDSGLLGDSLQWASDILYNLTKRRWPGSCEETVRPCSGLDRFTWLPSGQSFCGCSTWNTCGCSSWSELLLPRYPVTEVSDVTIDGLPVDSARFRIDDGFKLVYMPDPDDPTERRGWPCCQKVNAPPTEEGTFQFTMAFGEEPPIGGVMSAAILGCQLALGCQPETVGQCRLPKRVTAITRQGITVAAVLDPLELFSKGLTGIPEVDLWVQSENLGQASRGATVFMPGQRNRQTFRRPAAF
jgi:hypothetical protein